MGWVDEINDLVGTHSLEQVSTGQVLKAMILNGLGFVAAPLYLFGQFFEGKATEHYYPRLLKRPQTRPQTVHHRYGLYG